MIPGNPGVQERTGALGAYSRGVLGVLVMAVSLGTAGAVGDIAHMRFGVEGIAQQWLRAVACSALAVPLVVLLRRRLDDRSMNGLGLPSLRESLRTFGLGVLVTGAAAAAMFGLGVALGWVRFGAVSWTVLLLFVATNALLAFLYEALPEELTLRLIPGYLVLAAALFLVLARWRGRRIGWRDRDPEPARPAVA